MNVAISEPQGLGNIFDSVGDFLRNNAGSLSSLPLVGGVLSAGAAISQNNVDRNKAESLNAQNEELARNLALKAQFEAEAAAANAKAAELAKDAEEKQTQKYLLYGGIAVAGLALIYFVSKPKSSKKRK